MSRRVTIVAALLIGLAGAWWTYTRYQNQLAQQQEAAEAAAQAQAEDAGRVIWASGKLEPLRWAGLGLATSGNISAIHVREGEWVAAGQLLLEQENAGAESQVRVAEAAVAEAQASLDHLLAGATAAQVAAAEADLAAATANVALAAGQMLEVQAAIDMARAQVNMAQQQYNELASHPTEGEQTAAKARVAVAQAGVEQAQAAYNLVRSDPAIAARPESMTLRQMTAQLEAAQAEAALTTAGPTTQQLAVAAGNINIARTQLSAAESKAPGAEAAVRSALAQQARAQAALDNLLAGPSAEEIAIARARLQSAEAALASAQAQSRQSQLLAPFEAQIGALNVRVGEMATPGQYLVLLGDTRRMHVKTTDLRETDVTRLAIGMTAEVTFDALPERIFQGKLVEIAPTSTSERGSTNYTVQFEVAGLDPALLWGMTAFVNIQASN